MRTTCVWNETNQGYYSKHFSNMELSIFVPLTKYMESMWNSINLHSLCLHFACGGRSTQHLRCNLSKSLQKSLLFFCIFPQTANMIFLSYVSAQLFSYHSVQLIVSTGCNTEANSFLPRLKKEGAGVKTRCCIDEQHLKAAAIWTRSLVSFTPSLMITKRNLHVDDFMRLHLAIAFYVSLVPVKGEWLSNLYKEATNHLQIGIP